MSKSSGSVRKSRGGTPNPPDVNDVKRAFGLYDKKNYNKSVGAVAVGNKSLLIAAL